MTISASLVKELRERTGAGMMECKKALTEANGDIEKAIENMRKAGSAKAAKKAGRIAAEGKIVTLCSDDNSKAIMLEINCETDFVAKDAQFLEFCNGVAKLALENNATDVEVISELKCVEKTVEQNRQELVSKIGENIQIRRAVIVSNDHGCTCDYIHGGRIGVLISATGPQELCKGLAMHIAASNPEYIAIEDVDSSRIENEKEIFKAQAEQEGKPAEIIEKMVEGRVKKQLNEICLLEQEFVINPELKVSQALKEQNAEVFSFHRFELGEGIEKKTNNFAEEVRAQAEGA